MIVSPSDGRTVYILELSRLHCRLIGQMLYMYLEHSPDDKAALSLMAEMKQQSGDSISDSAPKHGVYTLGDDMPKDVIKVKSGPWFKSYEDTKAYNEYENLNRVSHIQESLDPTKLV